MKVMHRVTLAGLLALMSGLGQVAHAQEGAGRVAGKVIES